MHKKFITFEGGEGSGKSTQSKLLYNYLISQGEDVIFTREPGGTESAEEIRRLLVSGSESRWDKISEALLFYAARRDHVEKLIKPALLSGKTIICDRFNDSTIAYQGYGHGVDLSTLNQLAEIAIGEFKPGLTFIIDLPVAEGLKRAEARMASQSSSENRFEKMGFQFHENIRKGFHEISNASPERCHIINGHDSIENIHQQVVSVVERFKA